MGFALRSPAVDLDGRVRQRPLQKDLNVPEMFVAAKGSLA